MWYFVVGSIIAFVLSIFMVLMDYKARKINSKVPDNSFAAIAAGIGLLGVIILWPLVIIASLLVIYEIVDDLIRRYKFKKFINSVRNK